MANLERLESMPGVFGTWGFADSVNVQTGLPSPAYLSLDQGMIMAALGNALGDDVLRKAFATRDFRRAVRPVIGVEEFNVFPRRCTIHGTEGDDVLGGTRRRDVVCGLGGANRIRGRGGNDVLYGDGGGDVIWAGRGADTAYGDAGDDRLRGGKGEDVLAGGPGSDRLQVARRKAASTFGARPRP
jgi:Ca2+-binding RTX toxin-like protein